MKYLSTMSLRSIILASLCLASVEGCSRSEKSGKDMTPKEMEIKLNAVLQRMVSQSEDQGEIEQLKAAQIFHNLKDMPMEIVGVSVPIGTNRIHVSFTLEHFRKNRLEVLATEALRDLHLAEATRSKGPNGRVGKTIDQP